MVHFTLVSWTLWALCAVGAGLGRGRRYGVFLGIILGIYTACAVAVLPRLPLPPEVLWYAHGAAYVQWLSLIWPRMRPGWFRFAISLPGLYTSAAVLLAFPWAILIGLGFAPWGLAVPFVLAAIGLVQSLTARTETHHLSVGTEPHVEGVQRVKNSAEPSKERALKLIQLTDTHLGPFMSVQRLAGICERAVAAQPDLIVLTGDFLTMESQGDARYLTEALAPLRAMPGRVYACLGNHDHEAPEVVLAALKSANVRLLVDEAELVSTPAGMVQVLGFDFTYRDRAEHMQRVTREHPRVKGALRLALLHDPGAFRHLPPGEADLVLSGHTHGGQLGLVSLGSPRTVVSWIAKMPDHGLWGRGVDRLYVHRGNGHYGFPLRLGVPAEESTLLVHYSGWPAAAG
jgi:predicted MPP superfamily phosphohydrolase